MARPPIPQVIGRKTCDNILMSGRRKSIRMSPITGLVKELECLGSHRILLSANARNNGNLLLFNFLRIETRVVEHVTQDFKPFFKVARKDFERETEIISRVAKPNSGTQVFDLPADLLRRTG